MLPALAALAATIARPFRRARRTVMNTPLKDGPARKPGRGSRGFLRALNRVVLREPFRPDPKAADPVQAAARREHARKWRLARRRRKLRRPSPVARAPYVKGQPHLCGALNRLRSTGKRAKHLRRCDTYRAFVRASVAGGGP